MNIEEYKDSIQKKIGKEEAGKIADDIAQWHHDLEDALRGDAISKVRILKLIEKGLGESISSEDKENIKKFQIYI